MKQFTLKCMKSLGAFLLLAGVPMVTMAEFGETKGIAQELRAQAQKDNPDISPDFFGGNNIEFYPMLLNNVAGFDTVLAVSNLQDSAGSITICVVPAGTTQLQCTSGIVLAPRETAFFFAGFGPLAFLQNTTGQVYIFPGPGTMGASIAFILDQGGNGLTAVEPFTL